MSAKDGGPAFPCCEHMNEVGDPIHYDCSGMSLRDWFAGMALDGIIASGDQSKAGLIASWCYQLADAVLAEREKDTMPAKALAIVNERNGKPAGVDYELAEAALILARYIEGKPL